MLRQYRLYSKGRILGHKRGKRNSRPNQSLVAIEGVDTKEAARSYLGKVGFFDMGSGSRRASNESKGGRAGRFFRGWDYGIRRRYRGRERRKWSVRNDEDHEEDGWRYSGYRVVISDPPGVVAIMRTGGGASIVRDTWALWEIYFRSLLARSPRYLAAPDTVEICTDLQRIAYVYKAKREINGSRVRVIWG
jgi:ribosomal protein L35AE/L33A